MNIDKVYTSIFVLLVIIFFGLELFPVSIGPIDAFTNQLTVGIVLSAFGAVCGLIWADRLFPSMPQALLPLAFLGPFFGLTFLTLYMTVPVV